MTTATAAASPVQNGAFDVLNVASFTALASGGFYTDVPQGTAFPSAWLAFGDPAEDPLDTFGKTGAVVHLELHVYSTYEGDDECLDILSKGVELLHHQSITASGWTVPLVGRAFLGIAVEDFNGQALRHGIARLDVTAFRN